MSLLIIFIAVLAFDAFLLYLPIYFFAILPKRAKGQWWKRSVRARSAWSKAQSNHRVTVALLEGGMDINLLDLKGNLVPEEHFRRFTENGEVIEGPFAADNDRWHGTQMASVISGKMNNLIGTDGISHDALIFPVMCDDRDSTIRAINHVVDVKTDPASPDCLKNIRVINLSFTTKHSDALHDAIKRAYENGILVVASAGNEKSPTVNCPASYRETIAVSATVSGKDKQYPIKPRSKFDASFSNHGVAIDIAAPGNNVLVTSKNTRTDLSGGTSISAAMVSGAAALLFSLDMDASPDYIANVLLNSASRPTFVDVTERNDKYGFGVLNLEAAVEFMLDPEKKQPVKLWPRL